MSAKVDVIQARAHLMQQVNDHVRNGYRWWVSGTVPLEKAQTWAEKARVLYGTDEDRNRRARSKKAGRGSAYLLMYPLDRSIDNNRLGWILLVTDGIHPAHSGERLHRAEDDAVSIFGYTLVREPRKEKSQPVWTWRMTRSTTYEAWRERVIDTVRRGSGYDVRQMLKQLAGAPGFSAIRAQIKALHRLVGYEWERRHGKQAKKEYTLPRIWKCARMRIVSVDLSTYLRALAERRKEAAAAAADSAERAPELEPEVIYPTEPPAEQDPSAQPRKSSGRHARGENAQPVRQRSLPLPPMSASSSPPAVRNSSSTASPE